MLHYLTCDLLDCDADLICHQVNCQGVMGAGLARSIRTKYPEVFSAYVEKCTRYARSQALLGTVQAISIAPSKYIVNIFGQWRYGTDRRHTDYNALDRAFHTINERCKNKSIAIPYKMGCGLGGGDWNIVLNLIERNLTDCEVLICKKN
jgi:O-acetyl-ADP-ribose deacetylase (regulator of RNase III)